MDRGRGILESKNHFNNVRMQSARDFVDFLHGDSRALIHFVQLENKSMQRYRAFPIKKALEQVYDWIEADCYISLNTFKNNRRQVINTVRLNALYTDLDFYKIGIDIDEARSKIDDLIAAEEIPIPNVIIYSGRGLQLIWLIDLMVYSENYFKLWIRMQQAIYDRLQSLNADIAAKSASQIFRLPGSIHSITNTVVKAEYIKLIRYTITDLKDLLLDEHLEDCKQQVQYKKNIGNEKQLQNGKDKGATKCNLTLSSLNSARLKDLDKLLYIRAGNVNRRRFVFYYAAISRSNNIDVGLIRKSLQRINELFNKSLSQGVIESAIKSSEYKYKFTNKALIENLDITSKEQQQLTTIIDNKEKKRRKQVATESDRRSKGIQSMQEYNFKRAEQQKELLMLVAKYLDDGLKQREIALLLGITSSRISQLVKKLKEV